MPRVLNFRHGGRSVFRYFELIDDSMDALVRGMRRGDVVECEPGVIKSGEPHVIQYEGKTLVRYLSIIGDYLVLHAAKCEVPAVIIHTSVITWAGVVTRVFYRMDEIWEILSA